MFVRVKMVVIAKEPFPPIEHVRICRQGMAYPNNIVFFFIKFSVGMKTYFQIPQLLARLEFKRQFVFKSLCTHFVTLLSRMQSASWRTTCRNNFIDHL